MFLLPLSLIPGSSGHTSEGVQATRFLPRLVRSGNGNGVVWAPTWCWCICFYFSLRGKLLFSSLSAPLSLSGGVCGAAGGGAGFDGGGVCCAADIQGNTSASTKAINCSLTNARTLCFSWAELPSDAIRSHGCRCSTWVAISGQNSRNTFVSASRPSAHPNFVARAPAVRLPLG